MRQSWRRRRGRKFLSGRVNQQRYEDGRSRGSTPASEHPIGRRAHLHGRGIIMGRRSSQLMLRLVWQGSLQSRWLSTLAIFQLRIMLIPKLSTFPAKGNHELMELFLLMISEINNFRRSFLLPMAQPSKKTLPTCIKYQSLSGCNLLYEASTSKTKPSVDF